MTPTPRTWPTFADQLLTARTRLDLAQEIGLALRADRRRLHLSQRAYAVRRGLTNVMVARLEAHAGDLKLGDVVHALDGTAFELRLCHRAPEGEEPAGHGTVVAPGYWPRTELLARTRDGSRRFPAHHPTGQVSRPPLWWWNREATWAFAKEPNWYAPRTGAGWDVAS